jgi:hypothetical protein
MIKLPPLIARSAKQSNWQKQPFLIEWFLALTLPLWLLVIWALASGLIVVAFVMSLILPLVSKIRKL